MRKASFSVGVLLLGCLLCVMLTGCDLLQELLNQMKPYQEDFGNVVLGTNTGPTYWYVYPESTGSAAVITDPTGSGRGKVLELKDAIMGTHDKGIVVYSPVIDGLKTANLLGKKLELDFYRVDDVSARWFLLAKTQNGAFVMIDPYHSVDAYAALNHQYVGISPNTWYRLKITFGTGSYTVEVREAASSTLVGTISQAMNSENYAHLADQDGRICFGSWFSGAPDTSYGHVYIDNIKVGTL
ncbi:MAG: hypothetical protein WHT81_06300 [Rectinemataceae bacterium]|nr:hypothetical protein [Spirochaetaceae bacterium]